uniref:Uncharacterized protein n=1 Tax=Physcomitrium patens TaxID=3218 RepID=A0A2K1JH66_PHYPA|nr:hypothetical protein PHYPA_018303 [Physcomitrium patens]
MLTLLFIKKVNMYSFIGFNNT